jgi:S-adenosylmethionine-diacylgycerolhomoserine-N-methlytransferase
MTTAHATDLMNQAYRHQRYIYDLTRKYYLLGRDRMIAEMEAPEGARVLEIGCGTGRNLIVAAQKYPGARCFGIDVSTEMLNSAIRAILRAGLAARIRVAHADATRFDPELLFGMAQFDRIFISYSLSMIPQWQSVVSTANCGSSISAARNASRPHSGGCCGVGLRHFTSRLATISKRF